MFLSCVLLAAALCAGCGQKGDLTRPPAAPGVGTAPTGTSGTTTAPTAPLPDEDDGFDDDAFEDGLEDGDWQ